MKKLISIILSIIIFICLFTLMIILNVNILTKYKTIDKISSKINYLNLVNLDSKESDIKKAYDSIYFSLQQENISAENIELFYDQPFFKNITTKIVNQELNYLLTGKSKKQYDLEYLNKLSTKNINNIKKLNDTEKSKLIEAVNKSNSNIVLIEDSIRNKIDNTSQVKIKLLRYFLGYELKVILLCLIIISIILEFILNKEHILSYVFVPTTICSILELIVVISLPTIIYTYLTDKFFVNIFALYLNSFCNTLLFTALIILLISVIYLMINESIMRKERKIIKPRIKIKKKIDI